MSECWGLPCVTQGYVDDDDDDDDKLWLFPSQEEEHRKWLCNC